MRISSYWLLALPGLATAQQQVPFMDKLKGMLDQATNSFQRATSNVPNPQQAAGASIASSSVTPLTFGNWKDVIQHSGKIKPYNPPEAFMVFITGGNSSCNGMCYNANKAWNESIPWFVQDSSAPKLLSIDCEEEELLCGAWAATVPSIWVILRPQPLPDQSPGATTITIHPLNATTVDDAIITNIHTRREYLGVQPYEGVLHPWDGIIAKLGLTSPMAMSLYYLSKIPNWAFMIGLSLFSRYFVSRRMPPAAPENRRGQPQAGAATQ